MNRRGFILAGASALVAMPAHAVMVYNPSVGASAALGSSRRRRARERAELERRIVELERQWRIKQWGVSAKRVAAVQSRTARMLTPKPGPTNPSLWFVFLSIVGGAAMMIAGGIYLESER